MRIWIKFLVGSVLGLTIGMLLPENNASVTSAFQWLEKLTLGIGRYAVIPVLVFSLTIAVYELRNEGRFWRMVLNNLLFIAAASVVVIVLGIVVTLVFLPGRIPIETVEQIEILTLGTAQNIIDVFPSNMFSVLAGSGIYLFPVFIFSFILGCGLNYNKAYSKPVILLVDSLSRIFYHIASFFTEIIGFILIVLSAYWAYRFNELLQLQVYRGLILMLGVFSIVLCFGIFPLALYLLKQRNQPDVKINPWRVLYGSLGSALASFFSGDFNFSISVLQRNSKENLGIRRRSGALSIAMFSTFCRCGSAVVAASAFIVIIRSYSHLSLNPTEIFTIGLYTLVISFLLARHPGTGAYIALAALCLSYGGGEYKTGYLLLKPLAFYLITIGTFIDVMLTVFGSYFVAKANDYIDVKKNARFNTE